MVKRCDRSRPRATPKRRSGPRFLAVDFFCGAGGTTRGLLDAGGYVIAGIDKDGRCRETFCENNINRHIDRRTPRFLQYDVFPRTRDYPIGQQRVVFDALEDLIPFYKSRAEGVPLLFAICAPCQPFTKLSRKELSAQRTESRRRDTSLLLEATKFVRRFQPELVLSENVAGIKDPKYGGVWDSFRDRLERLGYLTGAKVICTSQFGIPQYRKRSIIVALRRDILRQNYVADLTGSELWIPESDPNAEFVSVRQAIGHLPPIRAGEMHETIPNHRSRKLSDLNLRRLASAKPGESNAYLEQTRFGDLSLDCHRKVNRRLRTRCFTDVYTRMRPDRPSPTMTTKCHSISNGRFGHYDVRQLRGISLREAAILQSFPESYLFYPKEQVEPIARMIGNAVPPKLAAFYAGYLAKLAMGT